MTVRDRSSGGYGDGAPSTMGDTLAVSATDRRPAPGLVDLLQIGAVCGMAIGIGLFAGYLIDRAAGTPPLFTFLGLAVGIVGAATGSYRVIRPFVSGASDRAPDSPEHAPEQKD